MTSFRFDHRLFQRGHTWRECLASWPVEREKFLAETLDVQILTETASTLNGLAVVDRIAVYYDPDSLDSSKTLPYAGNTFSGLERIETRYFDQSYFFPIFYPVLGRMIPRIFFVGHEGEISALWGPRPAGLTREMEDAVPERMGERDEWLSRLDKDRFRGDLDRDLAEYIKESFADRDILA